LAEALFDRLSQALADLGVELKSGQIIDATFVPVPIQRNGREDNAIIKQDAVPIDWGKSPAKLAQKDIDARWTKKGGQNHFGFKNHINIDRDTKLITASACTAANVHDSQVLDTVLRDEVTGGKEVWADSAYRSDEQEQRLEESKHESRIHERTYRNLFITTNPHSIHRDRIYSFIFRLSRHKEFSWKQLPHKLTTLNVASISPLLLAMSRRKWNNA
jgi:IS5 family transposase